ncbi:MAG: phosphatidate cytidylyltransferase [Oligoflexales bacterium]
MLKHRLLTALVGLPIVLAIFVFGEEWVVSFFLFCASAVSAYEVAQILYPLIPEVKDDQKTLKLLTTWTVFAAAGLYYFLGLCPFPRALEYGIFFIMISMLAISFVKPEPQVGFPIVTAFVFALVYCAVGWTFITNLYFRSSDSRYLILLLAIVWAGDSGAYFGGRKFGKTKLAPAISPKKTREGSIFGIVASIVAALIVYLVFGQDLGSLGQVLACAVFGGAAGQLGDLFESTMKRFGGVKDSGKLFPGHGGLLDRVDALLFAAPVLWIILSF